MTTRRPVISTGVLDPVASAIDAFLDVERATSVWTRSFKGEGPATIQRSRRLAAANLDGPRPAVVTLTTSAPGGSCSYEVNADGTGSTTVNFPPTFTAHFVIVDEKQEFRFIVSDSGAIASGVAKRQK